MDVYRIILAGNNRGQENSRQGIGDGQEVVFQSMERCSFYLLAWLLEWLICESIDWVKSIFASFFGLNSIGDIGKICNHIKKWKIRLLVKFIICQGFTTRIRRLE